MLSGASSCLKDGVTRLDLQSNYLLSYEVDEDEECNVINLTTNPLSREIMIRSRRLVEDLRSVHQISENRLLLQTSDNEWMLTSIKGQREELPASLA